MESIARDGDVWNSLFSVPIRQKVMDVWMVLMLYSGLFYWFITYSLLKIKEAKQLSYLVSPSVLFKLDLTLRNSKTIFHI